MQQCSRSRPLKWSTAYNADGSKTCSPMRFAEAVTEYAYNDEAVQKIIYKLFKDKYAKPTQYATLHDFKEAYDALSTPPTEEELEIGPSRIEALEAELADRSSSSCQSWQQKTTSAGPTPPPQRLALREVMAAFEAMGATRSELSAERVRLKCDDEYMLDWCSPAWMYPECACQACK
jgi:hypothetical protein